MSRTLAIVLVSLALAIGAVYMIWRFRLYLKREARRQSITNLIERAERGNKQALLKLYRERAFTEDEAEEFQLGSRFRSVTSSISAEAGMHPRGLNGWVAENLESPTLADFENLTGYFKLPEGAIRRRFAAALRTRDPVELLICTAYCNRWPYQVKGEVGEILWADLARALDEVTAARQGGHVSV